MLSPNAESGCRGFTGPIPPPLLIRVPKSVDWIISRWWHIQQALSKAAGWAREKLRACLSE